MAAVLPEVQQLREAVQTASALQEVVVHQLRCAGPRLDVNAEADREKSLQLLRQLVWLLQAGRSVGGNEI